MTERSDEKLGDKLDKEIKEIQLEGIVLVEWNEETSEREIEAKWRAQNDHSKNEIKDSVGVLEDMVETEIRDAKRPVKATTGKLQQNVHI